MILRNVVLPVVILVLYAGNARAQDGKITETGTVACQYWQAPVGCEQVKFEPPFAEPPVVSVGFSQIGGISSNSGMWTAVSVETGKVTEAGFTPVIYIAPQHPPQGAPGGDLMTAPFFTPVRYELSGFTRSVPQIVAGENLEHTYRISWVAIGSPIQHVVVHPQYLIVSVVYMPPGSTAGKGTGSVAYQAGSTSGTTTSASHTFKESTSITAGTKGGVAQVEAGVTFAKSRTDEQSLDLKHSFLRGTTFPGPVLDGINHDLDEILVWFNPPVELALGPKSVAWTLVGQQDARILPLLVGWLNRKIPLPSTQLKILQDNGITEAEYCKILKSNPLADPGAYCSANSKAAVPLEPRYVPISYPIAFQAPASGAEPRTETLQLSDMTTSTGTSIAEDSFQVKLSVGAGSDVGSKLTLEHTWEWTNKATNSTSLGTSTSATATIVGPAFGYPGKTFLQPYLDTVYHTFAFGFVGDQPVAFRGTIETAIGQPAKATEVVLIERVKAADGTNAVVDGRILRTFTDSKGQFVFYGKISGPATLRVGNVTREIPQLSTGENAFQLKME